LFHPNKVMIVNLIDKIGDWNPQLMREIQGRLKVIPVALTCFLSFLTQLVIFLYQLREFPGDKYPLSGTYCLESSVYQQQLEQISQKIDQLNREIVFLKNAKNLERVSEITQQLTQLHAKQQQIDDYLYRSNQFCPLDRINIQLWWLEHWHYIFISLSIVFVFTLLVAGTYLLINNLAQEEHRGTLNFLRLSPQSEASILIGKMLGVPILVYLAIAIAIPLHLWAARSAHLSWSHIFSFYIVLIASCCFFYSAALLFSFSRFLWNGLEPFLGSGAVLIFLIVTTGLDYNELRNSAIDWLILLSPSTIIFWKNNFLENLQFFYFPVGKNLLGVLAVYLLNYSLWTYWIWQGLKRIFQNPNAMFLGKGQSYLLTTCLQVIMWGFTCQDLKIYCYGSSFNCPYNSFEERFPLIVFLNIVFLLGLIFVISPRRQAVVDWARYRHQNISHSRLVWRNIWWQDWIWLEKSPSVVAMAINLIITTIPLLILIVVAAILNWDLLNEIGQDKAILAVAFYITWMMIYATLAQRMLLLKTPKRSLRAIASVAMVIFLPIISLTVLGIQPSEAPILWLFSTFPWSAFKDSTTPTIFIALFVQLSILILLNLELLRQVRLLGESATKALLAKR
jgi:hypothetical protein